MAKPSDFSPSAALEMRSNIAARESARARWLLRGVGVLVLAVGWAAVGLRDFGTAAFIVDSAAFVAMAAYAFSAAAISRWHAVAEERKLRMQLLVHNMELENMSMRDELTQLFNRRYLFDRLERELVTAKGFQRPLGYVAIELRSLSQVNETYGFEVGDQVVGALGRFLMECTRASDIPARLSGNEFGVILPDTSKRGAYTMVERFAQALSSAGLTGDDRLDGSLVVSFGVSGFPWSADTAGDIVRQAQLDLERRADDLEAVAEDEGPEHGDSDVPEVFRRVGDPTGL